MFSCVAGFVEVGETVEEAVHREVMEETGVELTSCGVVLPIASMTTPSPSLASTSNPIPVPPEEPALQTQADVSAVDSRTLTPSSSEKADPKQTRLRLPNPVMQDISGSLYYGSQPFPFPSSLMLGFIAKAKTTEVDLQDGELAEARWLSVRDMEAVFKAKSWRMRRGGTTKDTAGIRSSGSSSKSSEATSPPTISIPPPMAIAHQLIRFWLSRKKSELRSLNEAAISSSSPSSRL